MIIKKTFSIILMLVLLSTNLYSAGTGESTSKVKSNYDKAVTIIKTAKKY